MRNDCFFDLIYPEFKIKIAIHFSHRIGALVVSTLVIWTVARIIKYYRSEKKLYRPAMFLICALLLQLTLGAFTVWTQKDVLITTAHVATGALILGTSLFLTLRTRRYLAVAEKTSFAIQVGEAI